jgi:putative membrane protein
VLVALLLVLAAVVVGLFLATRTAEGESDDALATLRERYAAGDLDNEEFERRRDRLTGDAG